jgi:ADP-ribose pyrophosphatase YjhB (NUDIX family)
MIFNKDMKLIATITDKEVIGKKIEFKGEYSLRTAARAIVFNSEAKIAILNAKKYQFHKLPGGGVEGREDIKEALERELKEEIGCKVQIRKEVGEIIEIKNSYGQKQYSYCYVVKVLSKCNANLTKEEKECLGVEVKWVTVNKAIKLFEKDNPEDYTAKFIRYRDLMFLKELK